MSEEISAGSPSVGRSKARPPDVETRLADFIRSTSYGLFSERDDLEFKLWRIQPGQWFEGTYLFASEADCAAFRTQFEASAAQSAGSLIIGREPILIEAWEPFALARGGGGFTPFAPPAR